MTKEEELTARQKADMKTALERYTDLLATVESAREVTSDTYWLAGYKERTDEKNEALIGVTVVVEGTSTGAVTNNDGVYRISITGEHATLKFSYPGFRSQSIKVGAQKIIDVKLKEVETTVGQTVVTALGISRQKKAIPYAVDEINGMMSPRSCLEPHRN